VEYLSCIPSENLVFFLSSRQVNQFYERRIVNKKLQKAAKKHRKNVQRLKAKQKALKALAKQPQ
jgi:hypothetical protein